MAFTPADKYVTPTGIGLYNNIFGEDNKGGPGSREGGGLFGGDPFGYAKGAFDFQRLGYGILPGSEALDAATLESRGRYMGGPNNANWSDSWNQWNATDVVDPNTGQMLLSPMHQTGLRVGQGYGARDAQGNVLGPAGGDIFQGFTFTNNKLNEDPYLDPTQALGGYRGMMQSSPYGQPDPGQYSEAMRRSAGGPGAADFYGQRGVGQTQGLAGSTDFDRYGLRGIDQTNELARANLRQLSSGIDREAEETLATRLPEISHAMEAAGLGRSGAGQLQMLQSQKDIMSQANRDKQRVMADFTDREANRQAGAINLATQQGYGGEGQRFGAVADAYGLGSQIGAQGYEGYAGRQGQATMAGLGDQFSMNEANRQGERAGWQQAMDQNNQRYMGDSQNYLQALIGSGQYQLGTMDAERMGQQASMQDWLGLQAQREGMHQSKMEDYLRMGEQQRAIQQERINQQLAANYMPLDIMQRMTTGLSGSAGPQGGNTQPWWQGAVNGAMGEAGAGAAGWFADWMGNPRNNG